MSFKKLHYQNHPLLLCNVWDVASASIAEQIGFKAIATSSAAIAKSFGYADGQELSFKELLFLVKRIKSHTQIALSVDLEAGYANSTNGVIEHIKQLIDIGVAGINIEDSQVTQTRQLMDKQTFADRLAAIANYLKSQQVEFFVNARTDPYLVAHPTPLKETLARSKLYQQAGADGIFVPGMLLETEIQQLVTELELPVNLLALPDLPAINTLGSLGIKRLSMGNFLFEHSLKQLQASMQIMFEKQSFDELFKN